MSEIAVRFRIGLFVLAALVVIGTLFTMFGSLPRIFSTRDKYVVVFASAPGVGPGTPVRKAGVRIGEVDRVVLDDATGTVRVTILIDKGYTIRKNEGPVLVTSLLGETTLDFRLKTGDAKDDRTPVEPGTELAGQAPADTGAGLAELAPQASDSLREVRNLAAETRKALPQFEKTGQEVRVAARNWGNLGERLDVMLKVNEDKLNKSIENLNTTLDQLARVFNEENQKNLNQTLKNVRAASDSLGSISKNTDELLVESKTTMKRVNDSITKTDAVLANMQQATKPLAERSDSVMKNLDDSTAKLDKVLTEVRELLRLFAQEDGTLKKLLVDPSLYNNLNDSACMVSRILPRVDLILKDVQIFADKLARHPESIGIGGVVRPGSGIK